MSYVVDTQRVGDLIVQVMVDEASGDMSPRDWDNVAHIYGDHRNYDIGDGKPPSEHRYLLERGGIRLLYRAMRRYEGLVAFVKLGMYDHSGVSYYPVPMGSNGHHAFDQAGWDSGVTGYVYITRKDMEDAGFKPEEITEERAREIINGEISTYSSWANGEVYGYVVTKPCPDEGHEHDSDEQLARCPHSEHLDSCWGYIGEHEYAMSEGKSVAEYHNKEGVPA